MLEQLIAVVKDVAQEEIMPRYMQVVRQRKADGSFYTEADLVAQKVLLDKLQRIHPAAVMGEEMSIQQQHALWEAGDAGLWSVDPIDGTSNFFNGLPYFGVSVALMRKGRSILGVVYNPVTKELFYAEKGKGAYLNGIRLPLRNRQTHLRNAIANVDLKRLDRKLAAKIAASPPYASQRNFGACTLEWCYTAAGYFDLYLHGGQKPWDYAAGCLILEESGGSMCSFEQDDYWAGSPWQRSVIAALDPALFRQWRDWVRAHYQNDGISAV
ncbi:inositol monophosphatase family protein [Nitrosomonas sp. Nm34]|uniref:inositol monophosphatase family protein n=1 Tax=Nitrosomonas sp. Nm34 TaxID=1881055 RepID=UPI0008E8E046|nr:inositol monophosphatase family protein [Nitrosomonas sp. Nm34]SFI65449.1 myo-inositol-1(or 4)-monophosphatase [Nitrosomonas sp. Nm34]